MPKVNRDHGLEQKAWDAACRLRRAVDAARVYMEVSEVDLLDLYFLGQVVGAYHESKITHYVARLWGKSNINAVIINARHLAPQIRETNMLAARYEAETACLEDIAYQRSWYNYSRG